ncbi:palmitoyltransferase [Martiniozyma asiatica (nom. inval.)]|nr:palmitoyltransferase [Martiniozyma asiatica]
MLNTPQANNNIPATTAESPGEFSSSIEEGVLDKFHDTTNTSKNKNTTIEGSINKLPLWVRIRQWIYYIPSSRRPNSNKKKYQALTTCNYIYFCGGKFRTSKHLTHIYKNFKIHILPLTIAASILPLVIFLVFEASYFWHNVHPAVVIIFCFCWSLTFYNELKAALFDPGVLPKNVDLVEHPECLPPEYDTDENPIEIPGPIDIHGIMHPVQLKYCRTCYIWRPIRATHCGRCGVCVDFMDHHCPWLGNCIGQRNYWIFIQFLIFANITLIYLIVLGFFRVGKEGIKGSHWSLFLAIYGIICWSYGFLLLLFHIYAGFTGITTREFLNAESITGNKLKDACNLPFNSGSIWKNIKTQWFRPRGHALWRARDPLIENDPSVREIIVGEVV